MQDRPIADFFTAIVVVLIVTPVVVWGLLCATTVLPAWEMHLTFLACLGAGIRTAIKIHEKPVICMALAIGIVILLLGYILLLLSQHYGMLDD